jgi:type IV pilus assembly protein PilE
VKPARGFTLLELMVVVAIISLVAAYAAFNYGRYAFRTRRSEGQQTLMAIAAAEERYFTTYNTYVITTAGITLTGTNGLAFKSANSVNGYYAITVAAGASGDNQSYQLTATPAGSQVGDKCGNLLLDNAGAKTFSGNTSNGDCWK